MTPRNILDITRRVDFREWPSANNATEKECWFAVKRGKIKKGKFVLHVINHFCI